MEKETKELLKNAIKTQISIIKGMRILEAIGLLLEPGSIDKGNAVSFPNQMYAALTSNANVIYTYMGMTEDESRREAFDEAMYTYASLDLTVKDALIERHFFRTKYGEIRNDYANEDDRYISIDAWLTDDDSEEGTVIARVNMDTYVVEYIDPNASYDPYAQKIIQETITDLKAEQN